MCYNRLSSEPEIAVDLNVLSVVFYLLHSSVMTAITPGDRLNIM